jgi:hypothetical protein
MQVEETPNRLPSHTENHLASHQRYSFSSARFQKEVKTEPFPASVPAVSHQVHPYLENATHLATDSQGNAPTTLSGKVTHSNVADIVSQPTKAPDALGAIPPGHYTGEHSARPNPQSEMHTERDGRYASEPVNPFSLAGGNGGTAVNLKAGSGNIAGTNPFATNIAPQFDLRLKFDVVPTWNGDLDTLLRWLTKLNDLSKDSPQVYQQLGRVVPKRLEGAAETWYWSLPENYRSSIELNWGTLRTAITGFYMTHRWLDQMKSKASKAKYRDSAH